MSPSSVQVPIVRPPSYAPAWAENPAGVRVARTLDVADLLADRQLALVDVTVSVDPPLFADGFFVSDKAVSFFLLDAPSATARMRLRVCFDLQFSDGGSDRITVFQPISAPASPGLVPADVTDTLLSIDGEVITIDGDPIYAGPTAPVLLIGGEITTIGGEAIHE